MKSKEHAMTKAILISNQSQAKNRWQNNQHRPKIGSAQPKNKPKSVPGPTKIAPESVPGPAETHRKRNGNNEHTSTPERTFIFGQNVANMAATWPPKRAKIVKKINPKIDQILNCFWDRVWTPKSFQKRPQKCSRAIIAQKHASSF